MDSSHNHIPHILEMTLKEKQDFLNSFDSVFFDCDGVVWLVAGTIPNANHAINLLKDAGKKCKFISNNSIRSDAEYMENFQKIGVRNVLHKDIIHPAKAITHYIKTHLPEDAKLFSICSSTANELLRKNGIKIKTLEIQGNLNIPSLVEAIHPHGENMDAVIFDINLNVNYAQLALASLYLQQNEKCILIGGGSDTLLPVAKDLILIGCVRFFELLAQQTKNEPIVLGKPGNALCNVLMEIENIVDPKRVLFVGDTLNYDIAFARKCGFQSLLVLTGVSTKEDMLAVPYENRPNFHANGIVDFIEFFKDLKNI